jgi:hypothetical protein
VKKERRLSKIETLTLAKNYITALTEVVIANSSSAGGLPQPNNCNNDISNLISINNSIVINPSPSQDVNNNEATRTQRNNASANDGDDDLGDLEPTLFGTSADPFEII